MYFVVYFTSTAPWILVSSFIERCGANSVGVSYFLVFCSHMTLHQLVWHFTVKIALQKQCSIDFGGPKVFETPGEQEIMLFLWRNIGVIHVSLHVWKVNQQSPWFFFPSLKTKAHASWECGKRGHKSGIVGGGCWSTACPLWSATRWCVEWKMIRRSKRGTLGVEGFFSMKWWEYRHHVLGDAVQRFKWSILKSLGCSTSAYLKMVVYRYTGLPSKLSLSEGKL